MSSISQTMNFLNEAAGRYPDAVSFLAGRPPDECVDVDPVVGWIDTFVAASADPAACRRKLGQYSDTNGVVRDVLARYLTKSLDMPVTPADCMMINGAQEGMLIAAAGICKRARVALAADPTYVGFAGAAAVVGTPLETIVEDDDFVARLIARIADRSATPVGCVYVVPDFANPTGRVMTLSEREALVAAAQRSGVVLIEDIAYRRYRYEREDLPTLFTIARGDGVVLLESFAKTLLPGLRSGVLVAPAKDATGATLAERLSIEKSYVSVATSPVTQAALAGCLLAHDDDIAGVVAARVETVRRRRDLLVDSLTRIFAGSRVRWRVPEGGFFLTADVRHPFDLDDCLACAREARVLVLPMQAFSMHGSCASEIRLSFSNVAPDAIAPAIERLAAWLRAREEAPERRSQS